MKLRTQILLIFTLTSLAIIGITGFIFYNFIKDIEIKQTSAQLKAISRSKGERVTAFFKAKHAEHVYLKNSFKLNKSVDFYIEEQSKINEINLFNTLILEKEHIDRVNRVLLLDTAGFPIISSDVKLGDVKFWEYNAFQSALTDKLSEEYRLNEKDELVFVTASKLKDNVILLIEHDVYPIMSTANDYSGLGQTGETVFFKIGNDQKVIYQTPLRMYKKAFLINDNQQRTQLIVKSIKTNNPVIQNITDYRGKEIIAAVVAVPNTDWYVMTKIDKLEAFAYIEEIGKMTVYVAVGITLFAFLIIYLVAYFFVKPIYDLGHTAENIAKGALDLRVKVESKNEIGQLAKSFNKMTDSLVAAQKDLKLKVEELNRSNHSLDKFAHVVSHDLKTPLNSLEGIANLMKMEFSGKLTEDEMMIVAKLQEQTKNMKGLIAEILKHAELKSDTSTEKNVPDLNLNDLVHTVVSQMAIPEHIKVKVGMLPSVAVEKILMQQVFQNLLSNAVKYMDKTEGVVEIACKKDGDNYLFAVRDNGKGIPEDKINTIFELFNTGAEDKKFDSTGVGLNIVKEIIENEKGKVWVESTVDVGTTFFFTLPRKR